MWLWILLLRCLCMIFGCWENMTNSAYFAEFLCSQRQTWHDFVKGSVGISHILSPRSLSKSLSISLMRDEYVPAFSTAKRLQFAEGVCVHVCGNWGELGAGNKTLTKWHRETRAPKYLVKLTRIFISWESGITNRHCTYTSVLIFNNLDVSKRLRACCKSYF